MRRALTSPSKPTVKSSRRSRPAIPGPNTRVLRLQRLAGNSAIQRVFIQRAAAADGSSQEQAEAEAAAAALDAIMDPDAIAASLGGGEVKAEEMTAQQLPIQRQSSPDETEAPKPGAADVLSAVAETKEFKEATTRMKALSTDKLKADWGKLKAGEKVAAVVAGFTIAGGGLTGALFKPESRQFLESQISGKAIPIPGVDGLSLSLDLKDDKLTGGKLQFNVGAVLPKSWGFK